MRWGDIPFALKLRFHGAAIKLRCEIKDAARFANHCESDFPCSLPTGPFVRYHDEDSNTA
jgi:hypothetical protein